MCRNSSNYSTRAGLTLIEVLAALALLSTLLVGILLAGQRHTEQIRRSRQVLEVVHRVDELMYRWMATDGLIPREATGRLPGEEEFLWKTRVVSQDYAESLRIDVVRLEVFPRREASSDRPIVALELAVPAAQAPLGGD